MRARDNLVGATYGGVIFSAVNLWLALSTVPASCIGACARASGGAGSTPTLALHEDPASREEK